MAGLEAWPFLCTLAVFGTIGLVLAPGAGADDLSNPDNDITDVAVGSDADELFFNVTMAGGAPSSEPGERFYRINFTVRSAEEREAGAPTGRDFYITLDPDADPGRYVLWTDGKVVSLFGTELSTQPQPDGSTVVFRVDKGNARTLSDDPAEGGDAVVDVDVTFHNHTDPVDKEPGPHYVIPDLGISADRDLHLSATDPAPALGQRNLVPAAPGPEDTVRSDPIYAHDVGSVVFDGDPLEDPLVLESATVNLWTSFTTTSPFFALNAPNAHLYSVSPAGERTFLAQREAYTTSENTNIFTTPGEPHEFTWPLAFERSKVPAGHHLQLEVRSEGTLQGPMMLYYNSSSFDSTLHVDARLGEPPDVVTTNPPLGTFLFHMKGSSGALRPSDPGAGRAEATPANGGPNSTRATWTSSPLQADLPLKDLRGTTWISSVTSTPVFALNYIDFRVYNGTGEGAELVAQRKTVAQGDDENVFTLPGAPQRYSWPLTPYADRISAGNPIEVRVTAHAFPPYTSTAALVWSNGTDMDSRLRLDAGSLSTDVTPDPIAVDEEATFTVDPPPGKEPFSVTWEFGDGTTRTATTDGSPVSVSHTYNETGDYQAILNVESAAGKADGRKLDLRVVDPGNVTRLEDVSANPHLPEVGTVQVTWGSDAAGNTTVRYGPTPDDLSNEVTIDERVTYHVVNLTGLDPAATYYYEVQSGDVVSDVRNVTVAPDLTGDGHVVVANIDTGINPYHEAFRRPDMTAHPATYLTGFPEEAQPLELTFSASRYEDAVESDQEVWDGIREQETYWVPGTNLLVRDQGKVSFARSGPDARPILDETGHGTRVAGAVEKAHPGALILSIESTQAGALEWAANRPYVDVIVLSYNELAFGPTTDIPGGVKAAQENGKMLVVSAGNAPYPHTATQPNGPPQAIAVGGAHPSDRSDAFRAAQNPDVVSNFTVRNLPTAGTLDARGSDSGTSFAAPLAAGTLAKAVEDLRADLGDTDEATRDGLVNVDPVDAQGPYLDDGLLTNHEFRDATNRTAEYWNTTSYDPGSLYRHPADGPVPVAPGAPWIQQGWGFVGPALSDDLAATAAGEAHPTKPDAAQAYMEAHHDIRRRYHEEIGWDDIRPTVSPPPDPP